MMPTGGKDLHQQGELGIFMVPTASQKEAIPKSGNKENVRGSIKAREEQNGDHL